MTAPIIGLTCFRHLSDYGVSRLTVNEAYVRAVSRAGGVPLLIPLGLPENQLDDLLDRLDGIVFTGGGDVHPDVYGSQPHPLVDDVDTDRDRVEIHLFHRTQERRKPFLGICRGLQLINVALGGTLYEDILDQHEGAITHAYNTGFPRDHLAHDVLVEPGSRLAGIVQSDRLAVNSLHHQGIRRLASPLSASACAPDGVIEAVEMDGDRFGLAVQWHPEWLPEHTSMQAIFSCLTQAAASGGPAA